MERLETIQTEFDTPTRFAGPGILERPSIEVEQETETSHAGWKVTVYNNEYSTYEQVATILMLGTQCDEEEAYVETWEIDHYGKCDVHFSDESECQRAAGIIAQIGIQVEVLKEEL